MAIPMPESDRELVLTRVFNAPRERVFDAWTQIEHMTQWWGPKGFTVPHARIDLRVGGEYRACIRSPEGADYWIRGAYLEIDCPTRLIFTWAWEDDDGKPGIETRVELTFEAVNDKTLMTFRQGEFENIESRDSHEGGWSECFDRLQTWLSSTVVETTQ